MCNSVGTPKEALEQETATVKVNQKKKGLWQVLGEGKRGQLGRNTTNDDECKPLDGNKR